MYRLGFTESTLLFIYYLKTIHNIDDIKVGGVAGFINWLYSTSGFYDKKIKGDYFNFDAMACKESKVYNTYMKTILEKIKIYDKEKILCIHRLPEELNIHKNKFLEYINYGKGGYCHKNVIFDAIKLKNVLIIHNLGQLFKKQYESNKLKMIYPDFHDIKGMYIYEPGYTFCNTGPDESILDTANKHCINISEIIKKNNIDSVIISCGAYSVLLASYIVENHNIPVVCSGGELPCYFGVITKRSGNAFMTENNKEFWIPVPENMRPVNYNKIESGCYW